MDRRRVKPSTGAIERRIKVALALQGFLYEAAEDEEALAEEEAYDDDDDDDPSKPVRNAPPGMALYETLLIMHPSIADEVRDQQLARYESFLVSVRPRTTPPHTHPAVLAGPLRRGAVHPAHAAGISWCLQSLVDGAPAPWPLCNAACGMTGKGSSPWRPLSAFSVSCAVFFESRSRPSSSQQSGSQHMR